MPDNDSPSQNRPSRFRPALMSRRAVTDFLKTPVPSNFDERLRKECPNWEWGSGHITYGDALDLLAFVFEQTQAARNLYEKSVPGDAAHRTAIRQMQMAAEDFGALIEALDKLESKPQASESEPPRERKREVLKESIQTSLSRPEKPVRAETVLGEAATLLTPGSVFMQMPETRRWLNTQGSALSGALTRMEGALRDMVEGRPKRVPVRKNIDLRF